MDQLLPGVRIIEIPVNRDQRGEFRQIFDLELIRELGLESFAQVNASVSKRNVFRGFHMQMQPWAQGKLVQCISGQILDFILDPNPESKTFGEISQIRLSEDSSNAIWVPEQYAHGFLSLEENSRIVYAVSKPWRKASEITINPFSTSVSTELELSKLIISDKDRFAPNLADFASQSERHL